MDSYDGRASKEISFPPPKKILPVPRRGLLLAAPSQPWLKLAPAGGRKSSLFPENMVGLTVWDETFLAGPVMGAPLAVMALETLIRRGAEEIIFAGLAGSLGPGLEIGDIFCPHGGLSTEGTSAHYPAPLAPDTILREKLVAAAEREGAVRGGVVWSTDGVFRETEALVDEHRQRGALAVEMETTALWAAASFRGVRLAAILIISDVIDGNGHRQGFHLPQFRQGLERAARASWQVIEADFNKA